MNLNDYYYLHLSPKTYKYREKILSVSSNIEDSFSGRLDMIGLHIFFLEAVSLLRNSIKQYEQGFFDAAFYSIRSALELARIITYFSDQDKLYESDIYKKWMQREKFPHDSHIRGLLNKSSTAYVEVRAVLQDFFDVQDERLKRVQKYIHKQGYHTFYNQNASLPSLEEAPTSIIDNLFSEFLINSTVEIALLRLCIDPFPILLRDKSVMYKIHFESLTQPYNADTVKLIGREKIKKYTSTDFYKSTAISFNLNQSLVEPTYNLINDQCYDRSKWGLIQGQIHLLSCDDVLVVKIFNVSEDIARIYLYGGLRLYFSDTKSLRIRMGFDSREWQSLKGSKSKINYRSENIFMSYFMREKNEFWIEHNAKLTNQQIIQIVKILEG